MFQRLSFIEAQEKYSRGQEPGTYEVKSVYAVIEKLMSDEEVVSIRTICREASKSGLTEGEVMSALAALHGEKILVTETLVQKLENNSK